MTDGADEIEVYVDPELLTKAKGALMLEKGREPTDDETIGKALQRMVDAETETASVDTSPPPISESRVFDDRDYTLGEAVRDIGGKPDLDRFEYETERRTSNLADK